MPRDNILARRVRPTPHRTHAVERRRDREDLRRRQPRRAPEALVPIPDARIDELDRAAGV